MFQSTHPVWGATGPGKMGQLEKKYFNPRTPCGVRPLAILETIFGPSYFNPRTPCGVRPWTPWATSTTAPNFNPRTPCGVRQLNTAGYLQAQYISIHAPRVGCDIRDAVCIAFIVNISIHAPRVGCDG